MADFDPVRALKIAQRLRLVEPDASAQLLAAVERLAQESLEQTDIALHSDWDDMDVRR